MKPRSLNPTERLRSPAGLRRLKAAATFLLLFVSVSNSHGYSVLTHEAIIDSAWDDSIKPLLLKRFPDATPDDLKNARAYAYGGCVIQDMGFYPFGGKFFSHLVHYVRSGDFVEALLRDSQDINEYAFALGAVAHYAADNDGHRIAVNPSVPIVYPGLKRKYGGWVTYEQNPAAHLKTEFGFDVLQVAKGRYAPDAYHDYIGFSVATPLLERAFQEIYGLEMKSVFTHYDFAIGTYRRGVSAVIPKMTKVAWQIKKDEIQKSSPGITREKFLYRLSRANYERQWKEKYRQPGFGTKVLAFLIRIIPKVGPFSALSFRTPTPEAEKLFIASFDESVRLYERLLQERGQGRGVTLVNDNFDTGTVTGPGQYSLADSAYAGLLDRLAKNNFVHVTPELREVIVDYYSNPNADFSTKRHRKNWAKLLHQLDELKSSTGTNQQTSSAPPRGVTRDSTLLFPDFAAF